MGRVELEAAIIELSELMDREKTLEERTRSM